MNLTDLASVATVLSSAAVVGSLVYLGYQIRQSTHHQRASMQQGRAARTVDLLVQTAEPEFVNALLRGRAGEAQMEPAELEQFLRIATAMFISFEDGFVLRRSGMLDATTVAGDDAALINHVLPWTGYRMAWQMLKAGMQPDFRDYVDGLIEKIPPGSSPDRTVRWKALAAGASASRDTPAHG
jgi:hypothetical protein